MRFPETNFPFLLDNPRAPILAARSWTDSTEKKSVRTVISRKSGYYPPLRPAMPGVNSTPKRA